MHLTMQVTEVMSKVKNPSNAPAKIAPITLVAANSIAKRINDRRMVPQIPIISVVNAVHTHLLVPLLLNSVPAIAVIPRYTTAMPKTTHKNAGVSVIIVLKLRNAVIMPMIILATTANTVQLGLQLQLV